MWLDEVRVQIIHQTLKVFLVNQFNCFVFIFPHSTLIMSILLRFPLHNRNKKKTQVQFLHNKWNFTREEMCFGFFFWQTFLSVSARILVKETVQILRIMKTFSTPRFFLSNIQQFTTFHQQYENVSVVFKFSRMNKTNT